MTVEIAKTILAGYLQQLAARNWVAMRSERGDNLGHAMWMCGYAQNFDSAMKTMRWLGYVQGLLVGRGVYTLTEVKQHSERGWV